tara:strand:+ start:108 stop:284 length:177 start_codon:yes stop_codon:yes gene_type:complete
MIFAGVKAVCPADVGKAIGSYLGIDCRYHRSRIMMGGAVLDYRNTGIQEYRTLSVFKF